MSNHKKPTKDELIRKTGSIADAFSIFIAAGGNIAVWILFACMIVSIVNAAVEFPPAISLTIMLVQAVVLDIAGFGLQTIAKRLLKVQDVEVRRAALEGKRLAGLLIAMMIVTIMLVSGKTIAPAVFTDHNLVAKIQQYIDITDKILILARIGLTVMYTHTIHNLRDTESEMMEAIEKQTEANDKVALSNQEKIEALDTQVNDLAQQVNGVVNAVNALRDQVNVVNVSASQSTTSVDLEQFNALSQTVHSMKTSFTEVNQNILNITQNLYNTPGQHMASDPFTRHIEEVYIDQTPLQGIPERVSGEHDTDSLKALPVPYIEVPGVPQEKVNAAILEHLSGTAWGRIKGKYATTKLIRDAYENYLSTQGQRVNA